jgi:hypothetical protein
MIITGCICNRSGIIEIESWLWHGWGRLFSVDWNTILKGCLPYR